MATEYTDLSWIFDVRTKGDATWTPYTRENFPLPNPLEWWDGEHLGTSTCSPTDTPAERLTEELDSALTPIRIRVGPDMSGLRIRMWKDTEPDGDPDLIMEATKPQLALAHLRAAADPVHRARHELDNAKYRLRFTMTTLLRDLGKSDDEVDALVQAEIGDEFPGENLPQFLAGARLAKRVYNQLLFKGHQPRSLPLDLEEDEFTGTLFFWADHVRVSVHPDGTAWVKVDVDSGEAGVWLTEDASEEDERQVAAERERRTKLAQTQAHTLAAVLDSLKIHACTDQKQPVTAAELVTGNVYRLYPAVSRKGAL